MTEAKKKPSEKDVVIKQFVLLADKVHPWVVRIKNLVLMGTLTKLVKSLFIWSDLYINLEHSTDDNRKQCKDHVIESNRPTQPKRLSRA